MRTYIAPYKLGSASAKVLAGALQVKRVDGSKIFKPTDVIINWGNINLAPRGSPRIINKIDAISIAKNKYKTLSLLKAKGIPCVEFTTSKSEALRWVEDGNFIYARTTLDSSQGKGIVVISDTEDMINAPLYTKGIKAHEYRVHVAFGKVIDLQKKKRRTDVASSDYIRNSANGWVFCREEVRAPKELFEAAVKAVAAVGLDFGAVDILYREAENKVAVLEINTAPGIENTSVQIYTKAFKDNLRSIRY